MAKFTLTFLLSFLKALEYSPARVRGYVCVPEEGGGYLDDESTDTRELLERIDVSIFEGEFSKISYVEVVYALRTSEATEAYVEEVVKGLPRMHSARADRL